MRNTFSFDLHTHLNEKKFKASTYWERVLEIGLDGTAITEHADFRPKEAYEELLAEKPEGKLLVPGIEINSDKGHILAYSHSPEIYEIEEFMKKDVPLEDVIRLGRENNIMICISHPMGFSNDSLGFFFDAKDVEDMIIKNKLGVEVYNGMIGHLSNFIYDSAWIRRPRNFLSFLEKNIVSRKMRLSKIGSKLGGKIDEKSLEVVNRCASAIELGNIADFVVAGSDAHSAERIGSGMIKIRHRDMELDEGELLRSLRNKENIVWSGPLVRETSPGVFEKIEDPLKKMEIAQGLRYATTKVIREKNPLKRLRREKKE
ncbi:MAG: PHP-associated domain-containing protein [Candidatus Diapherotrites archaeon]